MTKVWLEVGGELGPASALLPEKKGEKLHICPDTPGE